MRCHICQIHERDLHDLTRKMDELMVLTTCPRADRQHIELEMRALASAKADINAKLLKHKQSLAHASV